MKLRQIEEQGSDRVGRIANKKEAVTLTSTVDDLGLILQKNSGYYVKHKPQDYSTWRERRNKPCLRVIG